MEIEIDVAMTRALLGSILRVAQWRRWLTLWILGGLMIVLSVLMLALGDIEPFEIVDLVLGLFLVSFPWLLTASAYRRLRRGTVTMMWSYRFTDEEIVERTPMVSSHREWTRVRSVTETKSLWVWRFQPAGAIGVPKEAFTAGQREQLRAFLVNRGFVPA